MKVLGLVVSCAVIFRGASAQAGAWAQCSGIGWNGPTICIPGYTCVFSNPYYSQCIPSTTTAPAPPTSSSTSSPPPTGTTATPTSTVPPSPPNTSGGPRKDVGKLPALGWNSWNAFRGDINEAKVMSTANSFISLGLKGVGYEYVNIDDCWSQLARVGGKIVPDTTKFPSGISGVATKIHALGLKVGIYSDAGSETCSGYPGSLNFEAVDAATLSDWGIDYLKYDNCNVPSEWNDSGNYADWSLSKSFERYKRMTDALNAVSRPIQYGLCNWGNAQVWTWGPKVGHSWRMTGDSSSTWAYIQSAVTNNANYLNYVGFYGHNDMDMNEIGNGPDFNGGKNPLCCVGIHEEPDTPRHRSVPTRPDAPLRALAFSLTADELAVIKNTELLAFHQDATYGAAAKQYKSTTPPEYFSGQSSKGIHVFIINFTSAASTRIVTFSEVPGLSAGVGYKVHNMWTKTDVGTFTNSYSASVVSHDTLVILITPT